MISLDIKIVLSEPLVVKAYWDERQFLGRGALVVFVIFSEDDLNFSIAKDRLEKLTLSELFPILTGIWNSHDKASFQIGPKTDSLQILFSVRKIDCRSSIFIGNHDDLSDLVHIKIIIGFGREELSIFIEFTLCLFVELKEAILKKLSPTVNCKKYYC